MAVLLDGGCGRRKKGGSFVSQRPREPKKVERNGMDGDTLSAGMGVFLLSTLCAKAAARKDEREADIIPSVEGSNNSVYLQCMHPFFMTSDNLLYW